MPKGLGNSGQGKGKKEKESCYRYQPSLVQDHISKGRVEAHPTTVPLALSTAPALGKCSIHLGHDLASESSLIKAYCLRKGVYKFLQKFTVS